MAALGVPFVNTEPMLLSTLHVGKGGIGGIPGIGSIWTLGVPDGVGSGVNGSGIRTGGVPDGVGSGVNWSGMRTGGVPDGVGSGVGGMIGGTTVPAHTDLQTITLSIPGAP